MDAAERHTRGQPSLDEVHARFRKVDAPPSATDLYIQQLSQHVIGQENAAQLVAREMVLTEAGMGAPTRPKALFLFAGPTGVGKTEMTEAIAKVLYGDSWKRHYKRIDCGNLTGTGDVTKLTGSGPKWVGYGNSLLITPELLEQDRGSIVVFDEIEKAHFEVWQAILSITDKAVLPVFLPTNKEQVANRSNKEVAPTDLRFHEAIIIFTSNAGSEDMQRTRRGTNMGFARQGLRDEDVKMAALQGLKHVFGAMPEFLGRIGKRQMIIFDELQPEDYQHIFDLEMDKVNDRIAGKILVSSPLKEWVIQQAIGDGEYGARDLRDAIEQHIVSAVASLRVSHATEHTTEIFVDRDGEELAFFEGDVVEEELVTQPKPTGKENAKTPKISVDFTFGSRFHIESPQIGIPSEDRVVAEIELVNKGETKGRIKISEVSIEKEAETIEYYPDKRFYRMALELDKVVRANPHAISAIAGNQKYVARNWFDSMKKGMGRMNVTTWRREDDIDSFVDFVFSLENFSEIEFLIAEGSHK